VSSPATDACLQTIPRTINTGLGALFILVALYVLGGETLTDFALALLIGIMVGTYSSVFTATPLAVWFEGRGDRPAGQRAEKPAGTPAGTPKVDQHVERARSEHRPGNQRRKPARRR